MVGGGEEDLLIAVSHSGSSKHVIQAVEIAKKKKDTDGSGHKF